MNTEDDDELIRPNIVGDDKSIFGPPYLTNRNWGLAVEYGPNENPALAYHCNLVLVATLARSDCLNLERWKHKSAYHSSATAVDEHQ